MFDHLSLEDKEALAGKAQKAYYNGAEPVLSDEDYDELIEVIQQEREGSPAVLTVGAPVPTDSVWPKVRHQIPMLSLDKVKTIEAATAWVNKYSRDLRNQPLPYEELLVTEKMDGLSISVTYEDGRLLHAVTRGGGIEGEDITPNVLRMQGMQNALPVSSIKGTLTLRGEIVLHKKEFKEFFADKKTARNAAAGTSRRSDGVGCEHLTVYFYQVQGREFVKDSDQFEWLESFGFLTPAWYVTVMAPGAKTPQDIWVEYQQSTRESLPYDIDGLVVRFNDLDYQQSLGETDHHPKGAVAFKFSDVQRDTAAVGLVLQVGGTGRCTPVAVLKPVRLLGAEVQRASLYNWAYIEKIGFHVGATVSVTRSNDVIPRVVSVVRGTGIPEPEPTTCPECGYPLERDGEYIICPNTAECPAQVEGRLKRWVQELNILEWGDVLIEKVVKGGLASNVPDLYKVPQAKLAALDRMGAASAKKAYDQLWSVVPLPVEQFVGALGIPLCATSTLELIVSAGFDTLDKLKAATVNDLQSIPGMGPKRAKALQGWFARNGHIIDQMLEAGIEIKARVVGSLSGASFCFTGKMQQKRPVLEKLAKDAGGSVKGSVGKGLTYLVISDPNSTSSKAVAARKNGTKCISEEDFLAMIEGV